MDLSRLGPSLYAALQGLRSALTPGSAKDGSAKDTTTSGAGLELDGRKVQGVVTRPAGSGSASASGSASGIDSLQQALWQSLQQVLSSLGLTPLKGGAASRQAVAGFLNEFYQALQVENGSLGGLITHVSSGSVPAGLEQAFSQLVADPQVGGTVVAQASASTTIGAASDLSGMRRLLLGYLQAVQQQVGYGDVPRPQPGMLVNAWA